VGPPSAMGPPSATAPPSTTGPPSRAGTPPGVDEQAEARARPIPIQARDGIDDPPDSKGGFLPIGAVARKARQRGFGRRPVGRASSRSAISSRSLRRPLESLFFRS